MPIRKSAIEKEPFPYLAGVHWTLEAGQNYWTRFSGPYDAWDTTSLDCISWRKLASLSTTTARTWQSAKCVELPSESASWLDGILCQIVNSVKWNRVKWVTKYTVKGAKTSFVGGHGVHEYVDVI